MVGWDMEVRKIDKRRKVTHEDFVKRVFSLVGDEYEVQSEYLSAKKYIEMKHNVCGNIWKIKPSDFVGRHNRKGNRCPMCNASKRKDTDGFKKEVYDIVGKEYEVLGNYINTHSKIQMLHMCGNVYEPTPHNFLAGSRCPNCISSSSEDIIGEFMNNVGIEFKTQYRNSKCRNKLPLPFDFKVITSNQVIMIEYDGEQHFIPINFSGKGYEKSKENLIVTQKNDNIKNQYCIDNNIPLIRIPYWEKDNVEYILENSLAYFNGKELNNKINKEVVERYLVDDSWNHNEYISWQHVENRYWLNNDSEHAC